MNTGVFSFHYGNPITGYRVRYKAGQGGAQYLGEAVVIGTCDDLSGQTTRSKGQGAPTTDRTDLVLQVPLTRGVNSLNNVPGALCVQIPDGTDFRGLKRGVGAVDLQAARGGNAQVASGDFSFVVGRSNTSSGNYSFTAGYSNTTAGLYSAALGFGNTTNANTAVFLAGESNTASASYAVAVGYSNTAAYGAVALGYDNTASNNYTVAAGYQCTASGQYAVSFGTINTASGTASTVSGGNANTANVNYSVVCGGQLNLADGDYSIVLGGRYGTTRSITGAMIYPGAGIWATAGASQAGVYVLGRSTTDGTATVLTTNGSGLTSGNQVNLPNGSAYTFEALITARQNTTGDMASWVVSGAIKRGANAAATSIVGSIATLTSAADSGAASWSVALTANTTYGGLQITVTGEAGKTIRWSAMVRTNELMG